MHEPMISVVVPAYNAKKYLCECLDSIAKQNCKDIEVICVNDGSTDSTLSIMREYECVDERFHVIDKPNSGYGDSMNKGMEAMRGKWMASVDSDDLIPPHALSRFLEVAETNDLDFVKSSRRFFCDDPIHGRLLHSSILRNASPDRFKKLINPSVNPWESGIKQGQPGLYRVSFLREHNILHNDTLGASFQDTGFWAQVLFYAKRAVLLDDELYYVRRDNHESSTNDKSKVYCICAEHDFVRQKALEVPYENREACLRSAAAMRFDGYQWNEKRIDPSDLQAFVMRESKDFHKLEDDDELNESYFSAEEWTQLRLLMDDPVEYYAALRYNDELSAIERRLESLLKRNDFLEQQLVDIKSSTSFRIGRAITWLPRTIKRQMGHKS